LLAAHSNFGDNACRHKDGDMNIKLLPTRNWSRQQVRMAVRDRLSTARKPTVDDSTTL
jgi:hypothetical protein